MISKPDPVKSRLMLHYLGCAMKRQKEREFAQKKLKAQLSQLKKISTHKLQGHLEELERRIAETMHIERKILKTQTQEDRLHENLKQKINKLEGKLGKYIDTTEERRKRIQELEDKISKKTNKKQEVILEITQAVQKMEKIYDEAKKSKKYKTKELQSIKKRINKLKEKLKEIKE